MDTPVDTSLYAAKPPGSRDDAISQIGSKQVPGGPSPPEGQSDGVLTSNIPTSVIHEVSESILQHTAALLDVRDSSDGGHVPRWGTSTLVRIRGVACALTAAHVWDALKESDRVGFAITEERHRLLVDPKTIAVVKRFGPRRKSPWFGPDLVVLSLSHDTAGSIEARGKTFLDLSKRRKAMLADRIGVNVGVWAAAGAPLSESKGTDQVPILYMGPYFSGVDASRVRNGFDYLDIGVNYENNPSAPKSFQGVSGGGLWRALLQRGADGVVSWDKKVRLEGVAFYQSSVRKKRRFIRCHGPVSVYGRLLDGIE